MPGGSFRHAHKTFIKQRDDEESIVLGAKTTDFLLGQIVDRNDTESIREAKLLAFNFYERVGEKTGNTALERTKEFLDEFLQIISRNSSFPPSREDLG